MTDTLLAHLNDRFSTGTENLATEALAYVLRNPQVAETFLRHVHQFAPGLPAITRFGTQVSGNDDAGIRDLVGSTANSTTPLVVEVKFGAPLTSNQPVTYLRALLELETPALLLFLVPTTRRRSLWPRIIRRCTDAGLYFEQENPDREFGVIRNVAVAITTWSQLLDELGGIPSSSENQQALAEIQQLRGLCEREDREGFRPFEQSFFEGDTGRQLLDLDGLLIEAVNQLQREELITTVGYKWTAGQGWFGKYFAIDGRQALIHVNFQRWGSQADTPLWLRVYPDSDPRVADALTPLRSVQPRRLFDDDGLLQIPILLPAGEDRDECLAAALDAIREVATMLQVLPPREAPTEPDFEDAT